ncbi:MAG: HIT domain-containing protein [candidate division Zixibacteria bacterium]|nr:HIT domain-containing protein [candidate division Zixibacteria bacterium]
MTDRLYAPWREDFVLGAKKKARRGARIQEGEECIFCDPQSRRHVRELLLHEGRRAYVVLNRYPYNSGHLMVVPFRHVGRLQDLNAAERSEIMALVALSEEVLTAVQQPAALNVGLNLGRAAGAGIDGHLHVHLVPRWVGDTNFMPALFDTRIISVDLKKVRRRLRVAFQQASSKPKRRR